VDEVVDAGLLEIGQELGVVEMALRVKVPVTDFDGMVEMKTGHAKIIACPVRKTQN
jgi:hypothetical protein